jgi:hypothetical protein
MFNNPSNYLDYLDYLGGMVVSLGVDWPLLCRAAPAAPRPTAVPVRDPV